MTFRVIRDSVCDLRLLDLIVITTDSCKLVVGKQYLCCKSIGEDTSRRRHRESGSEPFIPSCTVPFAKEHPFLFYMSLILHVVALWCSLTGLETLHSEILHGGNVLPSLFCETRVV